MFTNVTSVAALNFALLDAFRLKDLMFWLLATVRAAFLNLLVPVWEVR